MTELCLFIISKDLLQTNFESETNLCMRDENYEYNDNYF